MKVRFTASLVVLCIALGGVAVLAQARGGTPQTDKVQPVNSGANPYRVIRDWAQLTSREGRGAAPTAWPSIATARPCGRPTDARRGRRPGCLGTKANPVHHFDESGKEIRSFGGGMFVWPHGIHVDRDGNVWVTDARAPSADDLKKFPGEHNKGSVGRQVQPRRQGPHDAWQTGREGKSSRSADRSDRRRDRPGQRRRVRGGEPHRRDRSQSGRAHLGVRQEREVPQNDRQNGNRAGRVPDAARARVRFQGPADRRRSPQPSHPDPDEGREVRRASTTTSAASSGLAIDRNDVIYTADSESTERVHPGLAQGHPDRESQRRQGDDVHSAAQDGCLRKAPWAKASPSTPRATSTPRKPTCGA